MIKPNQCSGEMDSLPINSLSPQCEVEFEFIYPLLYIISVFDWSQTCLTGLPAGYSGSEIVAHSLIDPDNSFEQWTIPNDGYYELMAHLEEFAIFELPLLVGVSRKSMIYRLLGGTPQEALNGTTVLDTVALLKGADILRVHDVREAVEAVQITEKLKSQWKL